MHLCVFVCMCVCVWLCHELLELIAMQTSTSTPTATLQLAVNGQQLTLFFAYIFTPFWNLLYRCSKRRVWSLLLLLLLLPAFIYLPFAEAPSSVEWRFVVCSCCFRRELKKNEQQQKETRRERVRGRRGRGAGSGEGGGLEQPLGFAPLRTSSSTRALYFETFTAQEETKLTPNGIPYPLPHPSLPPTHTSPHSTDTP